MIVKKLSAVVAIMLLIAGIVPTAMEAYKSFNLNVEFGSSNIANEQKMLWIKNFDCTSNNNLQYIQNEHLHTVGSLVCPSGDILISGRSKKSPYPVMQWVSFRVLLDAENRRDTLAKGMASGSIPSNLYEGYPEMRTGK